MTSDSGGGEVYGFGMSRKRESCEVIIEWMTNQPPWLSRFIGIRPLTNPAFSVFLPGTGTPCTALSIE